MGSRGAVEDATLYRRTLCAMTSVSITVLRTLPADSLASSGVTSEQDARWERHHTQNRTKTALQARTHRYCEHYRTPTASITAQTLQAQQYAHRHKAQDAIIGNKARRKTRGTIAYTTEARTHALAREGGDEVGHEVLHEGVSGAGCSRCPGGYVRCAIHRVRRCAIHARVVNGAAQGGDELAPELNLSCARA